MVPSRRQSILRRRDAVLFILGAVGFYYISKFFQGTQKGSHDIVINASAPVHDQGVLSVLPDSEAGESDIAATVVLAHSPGWTLFRNLYMSDGTLHIVTNEPPSTFPALRNMISKSMFAYATPENIAAREPTFKEMDFVSTDIANKKWGGHVSTIEGTTVLNNDPSQFLDHYYHFVGEYFFGLWAFLRGALAANYISPSPRTLSSASKSYSQLPSIVDRFIFTNANIRGWRDNPGFNAYFLRALFPSTPVDTMEDWEDRVKATYPDFDSDGEDRIERVWHFPTVLLADRSSAFRGDLCGFTQRTAAEAWNYMVEAGLIDRHGRWWADIRRGLLQYSGVLSQEQVIQEVLEEKNAVALALQESLAAGAGHTEASVEIRQEIPRQMRIVYIDRQGGRRRLREGDHKGLVQAMEDLTMRKRAEGKDWVFNVIRAERLTKDEQVRVVSQATILLGVHGNGLTHLIWMKPTSVSAVFEMFYPKGFAKDYEWTTRSLGMRHFAVWNDTILTHPDQPQYADYPEGFQGENIPAHGPNIAKAIEDRLEGRVP